MELGNVLSKFSQKEKKQERFFALEIGIDTVTAAIWEVREGKTNVVAIGSLEDWETSETNEPLLNAIDASITKVLEEVEDEPNKIMFGLQEGWVEGDSISKQYTTLLKEVCEKFEFEPVGFVVTTEAIIQLLKKEEGTPPTTILIRVNEAELQVTVVNLGRIIGCEIVARSEDIGADVEEGLARFKVDEHLPSKMVMFNGSQDLEKLKQDILSYSWLEKLPFLHFPKVQILERKVAIRAVSLAGGEEAAKAMGFEIVIDGKAESVKNDETKEKTEEETPVSSKVAEEAELEPPTQEESKEEKPDERDSQETSKQENSEQTNENVIIKDASEIGFSSPQDETKEKAQSAESPHPFAPTPKRQDTTQDIRADQDRYYQSDDDQVNKSSYSALISQLGGSFALLRSLPRNIKSHLFVPSLTRKSGGPLLTVVIGIVLLLAALIAAYWYLPQATLVLYVEPKTLEKDIVVTIDPQTNGDSSENPIIPGKIVEIEVESTKEKQTTGKKTVGEKARGEVTIYNKTSSEKTFAAGTVLSGPNNLSFILDSEVTVASASAQESEESLTTVFGKANIQATAQNIGAEFNINSGEEFSIASFSQSSYNAKSSSVFEGGSSRDVSAVSQSDVDDLRQELTQALKDQAAEELEQKEGEGRQVLSEGALTEVLSENLSANIGDEAQSVTLSLSLRVKSLAYNEADFIEIVKLAVQESIPEQFELSQEKSSAKVQEITFEEERAELKFIYKATLLPKIDEQEIKKNLVGKYPSIAEEYLESLPNFSKATIEISPQFLPSRLKTFPRRMDNIKIEVLVEST